MKYIKFCSIILAVSFFSAFNAFAQSEVYTKNLIGLGVKMYHRVPNDFLASLVYKAEYQRAISKHISLEASLEYYNYDVESAQPYFVSKAKDFRPVIAINYFTRSAFDGFYVGVRASTLFRTSKSEITQTNGSIQTSDYTTNNLYLGLQTGYMFNFAKNFPTNVYLGLSTPISSNFQSSNWYNSLEVTIGITQSFSF